MNVLSADPKLGGWNATLVSESKEGGEDQMFMDYLRGAEHIVKPQANQDDLSRVAYSDMVNTIRTLQTSTNRKGVPFWSVPGEVWNIIFATKVFKRTSKGIGYQHVFERGNPLI
eukprot:2059274-Heterocapsa_arctica.AAC.1